MGKSMFSAIIRHLFSRTVNEGTQSISEEKAISNKTMNHDSGKELFQAARDATMVVQILHEMGFQDLRLISSDYHPFGIWQCWIVPRILVSAHHGARFIGDGDNQMPVVPKIAFELPHHYGLFCTPFGLAVSVTDTLNDVAIQLLDKWPEAADAGRGEDNEYAAWYRRMLALTEPDGVMTSYCERDEVHGKHEKGIAVSFGGGHDLRVPFPPPGTGTD